jgi:hypothetical protein
VLSDSEGESEGEEGPEPGAADAPCDEEEALVNTHRSPSTAAATAPAAGAGSAVASTATAAAPDVARKVLVQLEDYGSSFCMPSYGNRRPGVDYFTSNLQVQMFNIADCTRNVDFVYLYDERTSGKTSNDVCSLRWYHLCQELQKLSTKEEPTRLPTILVKVMDNCVGQNKSHTTFMFDAMLSCLVFDRVADLYLISGHSHMRPDRTTGHCKKAMKGQNIYCPEKLVEVFNQVKNMRSHLVTAEARVFRDWEGVLQRYFQKLPVGFTNFFYFEVSRGRCLFKPTADSAQENVHVFCTDLVYTRRGLLMDLFGLPETATVSQILAATLLLPVLPQKTLSEKKIESLAEKYATIPKLYRPYYPTPAGQPTTTTLSADVAEVVATTQQTKTASAKLVVTKRQQAVNASVAKQPDIALFFKTKPTAAPTPVPPPPAPQQEAPREEAPPPAQQVAHR